MNFSYKLVSRLGLVMCVSLINACGVSSQSKEATADNGQDSLRKDSDGRFTLIQPNVSGTSLSAAELDTLEIHLMTDELSGAKDYTRRVPYVPGSTLSMDQIAPGSYTVEVNLYSKSLIRLRSISTLIVKSNEAAKVDVDLKDVSDRGGISVDVAVRRR